MPTPTKKVSPSRIKIGFQELLGALGCAAILAYLIGWIYDVSYFDGLEAAWLADNLTPVHHLRSSLMPVIACAVFLISIVVGYYLAQLAKRDGESSPRAGPEDLAWRSLGVVVMFALLYLIDGWRMVPMGLVMGMMFVAGILIHVGSGGRQTPLYASLLLLVMPVYLGHIDAEYDLDPERTSLPLIRSIHIQGRAIHGILFTDNIVYCIDLDRRGEVIPVRTADIFQMGSVVKSRLGANHPGTASPPPTIERDASDDEPQVPVE